MTSYSDLIISQAGNVSFNLSAPALMDEAIRRGEGTLTDKGALVVRTGKYTGRSPEDKYIDAGELTDNEIDWGKVNKPFDPQKFDNLFGRVLAHIGGRDLFVYDGFAGANPEHRLPVRVITEMAWHNLFARNLFIKPTAEELASFNPEFTIVDVGQFHAVPEFDGTGSETFIILDFAKKLVLIGGTEYAGEIKKSAFTILNYILPHKGVMPMHCSANIGKSGDVAVFFGLSGTGKTTLSADPERSLIGDDEHGWSDEGIFNFEGGCYAKCIHLSEKTEPEIYSAVRFGTVLENVVVDRNTKAPDYDDARLTENTRAAYPLTYIPNSVIPSVGGHPSTILFLTADAFGVLPPVAKLTKEQAMYHFLSGYTSKLAGTERGITTPQTTFSTCFGAPFMPLHPTRYAELLGERLEKHGAKCYLVNTGWTGGKYGVGKRMDLPTTRQILRSILTGELENTEFTPDPVFGFLIPKEVPGVPTHLLQPRKTWPNAAEYDEAADDLAARFVANFEKFSKVAPEIRNAGPKPVKKAGVTV
jgi:phosphoenolpyruvate carboxykinase (ATP)